MNITAPNTTNRYRKLINPRCWLIDKNLWKNSKWIEILKLEKKQKGKKKEIILLDKSDNYVFHTRKKILFLNFNLWYIFSLNLRIKEVVIL